jgi:Domain of unknown function (DUF4282)
MSEFRAADLLSFDKMLSLSLVKVVYYLGVAGIAIAVVVAAFAGLAAMRFSATTGLGSLVVALGGGAVGLLVWRVVCELWMVTFGIHERLGAIKEQLSAPRN